MGKSENIFLEQYARNRVNFFELEINNDDAKKIVVATLIITSVFTFGILMQPVYAQDPAKSISEFYGTEINKGQIAFIWLGEGRGDFAGSASAGVMVRTSQHTVIIDPSNILPSDAINAIKSLDLILITHEHGDHFDPDSTVAIHEQTGAPVVVSAGVYPSLQEIIAKDKLIEMLPNDVKTVNEITIKAIPARHPVDRPVMYLISVDGLAIFHGSDSGFVDELNSINSEVHLAFVPAGKPSPTASPDDAAKMVRALKPYVTVPVHGMFEQMKALEDDVGNETVIMIPSAYVVKVPAQIVPEFPAAVLIFIAAFVMAFIAYVRIKPLPICNDID